MHTLGLSLYSHPKEISGNGVRTHANSKGKIPTTCTRKKFSPEEDRTHDAASSRTVSPTHYQQGIPSPLMKALVYCSVVDKITCTLQGFTSGPADFLHLPDKKLKEKKKGLPISKLPFAHFCCYLLQYNNDSVMSIMSITDIIEYTLKRKWRWTGHIATMKDNRWTKRCTEWQPRRGKRPRRRPSRRWQDDYNKEGENHLEQESNKQKTKEDIDGGLHPAVDGQSLDERRKTNNKDFKYVQVILSMSLCYCHCCCCCFAFFKSLAQSFHSIHNSR